MPSQSSCSPSFMPFHFSCSPNPHALPFVLPFHSSCSPNTYALPLPMPSHSSCPPTPVDLPLLLPSLSSCPPTPPALPLLLPSHSSCPPTSPVLPLLLPSYFFCSFVPSLCGRAWEGKRSRRAGGLEGQEEWEGRRAGLVQTPGRPNFKMLSRNLPQNIVL